MMVPRSFMFSSVPSPKPFEPKMKQHRPLQKSTVDVVIAPKSNSALQPPPGPSPQSMHTNPVVIPPKRGQQIRLTHAETARRDPRTPKRGRMTRQYSSNSLGDRPLPTSIASILEATAIPVLRRRRAVQVSRKLPPGNHVQDFSKLLLNGLDEYGTGNSTLEILLSPPDESEKAYISSDCDSETLSCSAPSISADSVPSLDTDVDSPPSLSTSFTPSSQRSPSERNIRRRRLSSCENCCSNHPLLETESSEITDEYIGVNRRSSSLSSTSKPFIMSRSFPRLGSFKSNLTASLRAIKSAAQSVSTFASPSVQPDDFLTRSFTITPKMTDDRRPPPMHDTPSPALRRYLNPIMVSPAEMYSFQDQPHETPDSRNCPISVQMQTYHRSGSRGSRKDRFRFSKSKNRGRQSSPFNPAVPPMSRQREPRENSDFLRMVVLEMNMRRRGKLRDDIPTRARVWLPPRKGSQTKSVPYDFEDEDEEESATPSRWIGVSIESI
ncbi:hypothetical protein BJY04DRAFT_176005 [Aspergillus karnatakaensis]|uniref:uncharacterized protein n=1 Tax=Aspergillus karnatakaensis TaxID=1810916 RepID=UPI003CCD857E